MVRNATVTAAQRWYSIPVDPETFQAVRYEWGRVLEWIKATGSEIGVKLDARRPEFQFRHAASREAFRATFLASSQIGGVR